jgi:2-aminoethylphosphonate-pyruvate transaminase
MTARDKLLFTPGPFITSRTVKQAMLRDLGPRDFEFISLVKDIRRRLLALGGVENAGYVAIPMQGCGTYSVEAVISSTVPPDGKLLVVVNGAYGKRIARMAAVLKIPTVQLTYPENIRPQPQQDVAAQLKSDPAITHVAMIHCETTTGVLNPIKEVGQVVREFGRIYFVDAMSSFGAVPINLKECGIDYLVSSSNKCIEGVPGFAFTLARRDALLATEGYARSLSLDLLAQWKGLEKDGQFRFTATTHVMLAFHQALLELEAEGGIEARMARYQENYTVLTEGMRDLGFEEYLRPEDQSHIITSFRYPKHPNWDFEEFYRRLNEKGYVIYPGKLSDADCFRIGTIGRIYPNEMYELLGGITRVVKEMGLDMPRRAAAS